MNGATPSGGVPLAPPPQLTHIGTGSGLRSLAKRRERAGVASDATGWTVDRAAAARRVRAAMGRFLSPDTGASPTLGHEKTEGTGVYVCSRFVVRAVPVRGVAGWRSLGVLPRSRGASDVSSDVKPRSGEIWRPAAPHALIPFSLLERGTARATRLRPLSVVAVERLRDQGCEL